MDSSVDDLSFLTENEKKELLLKNNDTIVYSKSDVVAPSPVAMPYFCPR
jgi:hypothetical protein